MMILNEELEEKYVLDPTQNLKRKYPDCKILVEKRRFLMIAESSEKTGIADDFRIYFKFSEVDYDTMTDELVESGYVTRVVSDDLDIKKEINNKTNEELVNLLKRQGVTASGKRKKLLKLALKHIPAEKIEDNNFKITPEGKKFLKDHEWISTVLTLNGSFDFYESYDYILTHEGDLKDIALEFAGKHMKLAMYQENFQYYLECLSVVCEIYMEFEDYLNALKYILKYIIERANPRYYSYEEYIADKFVFKYFYTFKIDECMEELELSDINELFDEVWDSTDFKHQYSSKEELYDYLVKILDGENIEKLSDKYIMKYFDTAEEYYKTALFYLSKGKNKEALYYFDLYLEVEENDPDVIYYMSLACKRELRLAEMEDIVDEALDLYPDDYRFWYLKGALKRSRKEFDNAEKYLKKSLELESNIFAWMEYGMLYCNLKDYKKSVECFDKAYKATGNAAALIGKGQPYYEMEEYDEVEKCFDEAYEVLGENIDFYMEKAKYYFYNDQLEKSLECVDKCIELNEYDPYPLLLKANIMKGKNNIREMKKCEKKANMENVKLHPGLESLMYPELREI